ncbi:dihydrofolate reductase family protein [Glutamicibacter sp. PS]|uniref:dihydrofolate reductase family protein n=1 Tax=Glutamicibacter sp. PS TaxID=3075634 RepID=UPI00284367BA|nr:dihydrofolate reductase family protein [Glutamicibacter sp. PS]MDR4533493.1 dihydrofolate reductase family protein [Glutamicibacter sp. PS]
MGSLSYTATISLDGFAAGPDGDFQFGAPDEEVFAFHVQRMEHISTEVLGRKTYQLMTYWEEAPEGENWGADEAEFSRRWRNLQHMVISSTLTEHDLSHSGTELRPHLPLEALREIVQQAPGEVEIFGPTTAAPAIKAGMVDNYRFFIVPKTLGGGLAALPAQVSLDLRLAEHRIFGNGTVYLHYVNR